MTAHSQVIHMPGVIRSAGKPAFFVQYYAWESMSSVSTSPWNSHSLLLCLGMSWWNC